MKLNANSAPITTSGIDGRSVRRLMRAHRVTIRQLAAAMQITLKAVRRYRTAGASFYGSLDVVEAIRQVQDGADRPQGLTPRESAMLRQYQAQNLKFF